MAVTIRLRRAGSKKNAIFHLIASDSRKPRDGRFIERLGFYDPRQEPSKFEVDTERLKYWVSKGATTSQTVKQLIAKQAKVVGGES
jgi:small subunit ribosomal protein S16